MPSTRLHIDPTARAVTAIAAAGGEAEMIRNAATGPAEYLAPAAQGAAPNGFNQAAAGLTTAAGSVRQVVAQALASCAVTIGSASESGFNALDQTNARNAVDLATIGGQQR
jgi:hypothetical protein